MKKALALACLAALLCSCATGYRRLNWTDIGYEETQLDFNNYLVTYHGGDLEYCKKAGLYRAAELCKGLGFSYFKVKSEQVRSTFMARTQNPIGNRAENPGYMVENASGLERKDDAAGYSYKVEFMKTKSSAEGVFDADEVLRRGIPGEGKSEKKSGDGNGK